MNNEVLIYLDNNSTTLIDERIFDEMIPFLKNLYGNASSTHSLGLNSKKAIDNAKTQIAQLINAESNEITLTSGATESINLALKGLALNSNNSKKHILTVKTEHNAVLETCKYLETVGFEVEYLDVDKEGLVNLEQIKKALRKDTLLVCIMWVNNETGVIQPIQEISKILRNSGVFFMSDATQAVGKIPIDLFELEIDLLCFSAHKFYGPKGIGALYINAKKIKINQISPLQHGGGHENGLRSGTLNVPAIVGFGKACDIAISEMEINKKNIGSLKVDLEDKLLQIDGAFINGSKDNQLYNTINICLPNFDANKFIGMHQNIAVSNGSACAAAIFEPSHVLISMGLTNDEALGSLRISLGKYNTLNEIDKFLEIIKTTTNNA